MSRKQKKVTIRICVSLILGVAVYLLSELLPITNMWLKIGLFAVPYLIIGYDVLWSALNNILHGRVFDEKFLMSIATIGAFFIAEYAEAVAVMIFYQVGELFQSIAVGKSRKSISSLMDIRPDYAVVIRGGLEEKVSPEEVKKGEIIIVRAGEKIALDGEIVEGITAVNAAALTGESLPVDKKTGDKVISGSINISGVIKIRVESEYGESTVSKILELVENSSAKKSKIESFISRFAKWYTPCVVIGALVLGVGVPLIFSSSFSVWVSRALMFLVVSCPCALVVSVPMSFFGGIGGAARNGILIKGANYFETLAKVDTIAFDKTGTITEGSFSVNAIHPSAVSKDELLDIAAAAESYSHHPLAESVIKAHSGHIDKSRISSASEIAGMGVKAVVDGKTFYVGNGALMEKVNAKWHECHLTGTTIHIAEGDKYLGHIVITDTVKNDSASAIKELKSLGIKRTVMLTGDREQVANEVGEVVGVDLVKAALLPKDKVEEVEKLLNDGSRLAFVGDGINDAPVLARADVGVAMGALGSDAAIESADVVIMDDKLSKLPVAIRLARKTMKIAKENVWFALTIKAAILALSALGLVNMWIAVFGDVGVMILAVLNSMRSIFGGKTKLKA